MRGQRDQAAGPAVAVLWVTKRTLYISSALISPYCSVTWKTRATVTAGGCAAGRTALALPRRALIGPASAHGDFRQPEQHN